MKNTDIPDLRHLVILLTTCLVCACVGIQPQQIVNQGPCESSRARLDADFSGGGMHACAVLSERTFLVYINPEDMPINPSPWYAVRLSPKVPGQVRIKIKYADAQHRYWPKISPDLSSWQRLDRRMVKRRKGQRAEFHIKLENRPVYLSAQELYTNDVYQKWELKLADTTDLTRTVIGQSVDGRNITMLSSSAPLNDKNVVIFVGRQHPPEVTGALAMNNFLTTVMLNTELAKNFRQHFSIVMIPNMNPDGVEQGHWRHNMQGADLNRDWGPFIQPETKAVKKVLDQLEAAGKNPVLFLDFHSTRRNVFYTQTIEDESTDYDFTGNWLNNAAARLPGYEFERAERHNTDLATSKNYMYSRFKIPAITYELGDETNRKLIQKSGQIFAEEMMKLLLKHETE